jgi:8-oxo-dGTP diphosphatase
MSNVTLFIASKALIVREGKVLVIRESGTYKDGVHAQKYDLPGGRLEAGEHFDEALKREVKEETGLAVVLGNPILVNESWPVVRGEQWQIVRMFFTCPAEVGEVVLSEDHDDFKWIDPQNYKSESLIENLYPVFEAYINRM